jgi:hypothetical protein
VHFAATARLPCPRHADPFVAAAANQLRRRDAEPVVRPADNRRCRGRYQPPRYAAERDRQVLQFHLTPIGAKQDVPRDGAVPALRLRDTQIEPEFFRVERDRARRVLYRLAEDGQERALSSDARCLRPGVARRDGRIVVPGQGERGHTECVQLVERGIASQVQGG